MRKLVLPGVLLLVNISINALPFTKEQIQYYEDQAIFQTKLNIAEVILQEGEISLLEYPIYEYQIYSIGSTKLRLLRNAIFAKHGYIFKDQELKKYFEGKDWYKPRFEEIPKDLDQNETDNVELLFETQKIWDAHEALRINDEDLIGMWHQMPVVPAGFANRYFFYSDHGFKFASNEMDAAAE